METNIDSVCNWVKSTRKSKKKTKVYKSVTVSLFKENNKQVSARLNIEYNLNTKNVMFTHGLYYLGNLYHPDVHINKLKCINKHTIEQYRKNLDYNNNIKSMSINLTLDNYIHLYTRITYNCNNKHIKIRDELHYKSECIKIGTYKKR